MKSAKNMTEKQIGEELFELEQKWSNLDREGSGSPGEWIVERMDELDTELKRRLGKLGA